MIRRFLTLKVIASLMLLIAAAAAPARAQQANAHVASASGPAPAEIDRIVRAFTAKETEFRRALSEYRFKRDALVQTIGLGGQVTGEYRRTSNFVFDDAGGRYERITFAPQPTLTEVQFTNEDLEDLGGVQPFALELSKIDRYDFRYAGRERLDEIDTYVFDVAAKIVPKKVSERFFAGRVWVDERDLQIVKVRGKGVPEGDQRFPTFETYREQIDGKFWFPTYTSADDQLVFPSGQTVHIRMLIKLSEFARARGSSKIVDEGEIIDESPAKPTPTPKKP